MTFNLRSSIVCAVPFNLAKHFTRVIYFLPALLGYLDLAFTAHSWYSHYNSLDLNLILLNH